MQTLRQCSALHSQNLVKQAISIVRYNAVQCMQCVVVWVKVSKAQFSDMGLSLKMDTSVSCDTADSHQKMNTVTTGMNIQILIFRVFLFVLLAKTA